LPIDRLEPHPENANRMSADRLEKLKGHIARTGLYEPLVVRPMRNAAPRPCSPSRASGSNEGRPEQSRRAECGMRNERQRSETDPSGERLSTLHSALPGTGTARAVAGRTPHFRYQILNGHHRAEVLKALGHTRARCDVWDVDDDEARMLLATLNRLEGRDDPKARARLVAHLATGRSAEDLARLLPEPPDAVERLLRLAEPPPEPAAAESLAPLPQALIFFLSEEQEVLVREALGAVGEKNNAECRTQNALREPQGPEHGRRAERTRLRSLARTSPGQAANGSARSCSSRPRKRAGTCESHRSPEGDSSRLGRAERLERLALWYLESVGRR